MLKKIFSVVVLVSFLVNSISFADNTLAPESRLAPISDNTVWLDIMKLTAEITHLNQEVDIIDRDGIVRYTIDEIDADTVGSDTVVRLGDVIMFSFAEKGKKVVGDTIFLPCRIINPESMGNQEMYERVYLCIAKKTGVAGIYDYEFVPVSSHRHDAVEEEKPIDMAINDRDLGGLVQFSDILNNDRLLQELAKKSRPEEVRAGIARFVKQQETDRFIAEQIRRGRAERLKVREGYTTLPTIIDCLERNDFKVAGQFKQLVESGQVMYIPGLTEPHAGGVGIYFGEESPGIKKTVHEIFAKCGFSHEEATQMEHIFFDKLLSVGARKNKLTADEKRLLARAKEATFENRWDEPLKIDYNKVTAEGIASRRIFSLIKPGEGALELVKMLIDADLGNLAVEIAFRGDNRDATLDLIRKAVKYKFDKQPMSKTIIAAGTVLNIEDARDAVKAGAAYIVTPGLTLSRKDVNEIENMEGVQVVMGVGSEVEASEATKRWANKVKVFPFKRKAGDPIAAHKEALKGPMPEEFYGLLGAVTIIEDDTERLEATFTNLHEFFKFVKNEAVAAGQGQDLVAYATANKLLGRYKLPESGETLFAAVKEKTGNKPLVITGGVNPGMVLAGLLENLGTATALSVTSVAVVNELKWLLTASTEAQNAALEIATLLKGPFTPGNLKRLDEAIDTLMRDNPAVTKELLSTGAPKAVSAAIIERLALPEVALKSPIRNREYVDTALTNEDTSTSGKALGVKRILDASRSDETLPQFKLPVELESLANCSYTQDIIRGITRQDPSWGFSKDRVIKEGKPQDVTKPPRTTILEQHPNADQYFYVEEGELIILAADHYLQLHAYLLKKDDIIRVAANTYHIAVNKTPNVKFRVYNGNIENNNESVTPKTTITCIGTTFDATAISLEGKCTVQPTNTNINGANVEELIRKLPEGFIIDKPQIVSAKIAPNAGMNLVSLMVLFPGQTEPVEVLTTESLENLQKRFAEGDHNLYGKNAFTTAGAIIGPLPNRFTGPIVNGKVEVTLPDGNKVYLPANHGGNEEGKKHRYHLHGFFHRLKQSVSTRYYKVLGLKKFAEVGGRVNVNGESEEWPWPSDSTIVTNRAVISDNKLITTVTQTNTGNRKTWASWVEHSYYKHLPGCTRDDVHLKLPAKAMTPVGVYPPGHPKAGLPDYEMCLPTGEIRNLKGTQYERFTRSEGGALGNLFLDDCFTSLIPQADGSIVVEVLYKKLGYKLRVRAYDKVTRADGTVETGKLKSIQIYSPDTSEFICIEIGAHLNNPFDKDTWGDTDTGMVKLNPNDTYEYTVETEYLAMTEEEMAEAPEPANLTGTTEADIDMAAAEVSRNKTVVFVSQDFADKARCEDLMPGATFVPFNQKTGLSELPGILSNPQYADYKKVLLTVGLETKDINNIIAKNEEAFTDVTPLNIDEAAFAEIRKDAERARIFQKGILTMGLLAAALTEHKEDYKETRSYQLLRSLLTMIFDDNRVAEFYIRNIVNPDGVSVLTRFGNLITRILGPVRQHFINTFTRIVNYFA